MADDRNSSEPSPERAQKRAVERRHERTETVEDALSRGSGLFEEEKYPVTAEELAVEYGDEVLDLPNETESLGSVFDRPLLVHTGPTLLQNAPNLMVWELLSQRKTLASESLTTATRSAAL
jgi:hypothetical protein